MLIKSLIPDFFFIALLDFQCEKYAIAIVLKGHLKTSPALLGENI